MPVSIEGRTWNGCAFLVVGILLSLNARAQNADTIETVTVTAERRQLLGTALTSSQGVVVDDELTLTPAFRVGQMLETVPGLVVTSHSGEGKANQYLLRGFNLDHGTDLAVGVDGMPVNERSHAHGQGYADLNFLVPELAVDERFTKGPYFAEKGDFSSVGSVDLSYRDTINDQAELSVGSQGFERLFSAGSAETSDGVMLGALELQHYDGPWVHADDQRKLNAVLRYSAGDEQDGYSVTGMYYGGVWNATTDQPQRAIGEGLISRFGSLDPSDGGQAQRYSLSGQYHAALGPGELKANAYAIANRLTLWNDFTHFLIDPLNGDQEAQTENRLTLGGGAHYDETDAILGFANDLTAGVETRYDNVHLAHLHTKDRIFLALTDRDRIQESSISGYAQLTTHWTGWLRSVLGVREDYFNAQDGGTNHGHAEQDLFQPKGSLIATLSPDAELYLSAGRGFHSDDVRGVTQAAQHGLSGAPLLARSTGWEAGMREQFLPNLSATLTAFEIQFQSELTYDPDIGQTSAGPPSRRRGIELNTTWQALEWLELYGSIAASNARYTQSTDDGTGHIGRFIPNAPDAVASFAAYIKDLGPWGGGLDYRYLGAYPLSSDDRVRGKGYGEWNAEIGYTLQTGWKLGMGVYNILNTRANAAEFWYIDRLPGEPAGGVADVHVHPLEPVSVRFTIGKAF